MNDEDIVAFAKTHCEERRDDFFGRSYRCSAVLTDGVFLPCVVIASKESQVQLALRRFEETQQDGRKMFGRRKFGAGFDYASIVESFVTAGNRVNGYEISELGMSDFAIPIERLREIHGETSMSWTQFTGTMVDGKEFSFGTTFSFEFFNIPSGYTARDIRSVTSHKRLDGEPLYRERPFFKCYVRGI